MLCICSASAWADDGVVIALSGPAVPYERVDYAVQAKRGTVVAEVNKQFAHRFGRQDAVAALTREELDGLLDVLARMGVWRLKSRRTAQHRTRWRIAVVRGRRTHVVVVDDPAERPDGRHYAVIEHVRRTVTDRTRALPFHDAMLLRSEAGALALRTRPPARVRLNGVLLPRPTPIQGLRVKAGKHRVEFLPLEPGALRARSTPYDIVVEAGRATSLNVTLE
jgi:hypothetical protein